MLLEMHTGKQEREEKKIPTNKKGKACNAKKRKEKTVLWLHFKYLFIWWMFGEMKKHHKHVSANSSGNICSINNKNSLNKEKLTIA